VVASAYPPRTLGIQYRLHTPRRRGLSPVSGHTATRHACSDIKPRELPGPHGRIHYGITRSSDTTNPAFTRTHSHAPHRARAAAQQLDDAALRLLKLARRPVMSSTARAAQHPCHGPGAGRRVSARRLRHRAPRRVRGAVEPQRRTRCFFLYL